MPWARSSNALRTGRGADPVGRPASPIRPRRTPRWSATPGLNTRTSSSAGPAADRRDLGAPDRRAAARPGRVATTERPDRLEGHQHVVGQPGTGRCPRRTRRSGPRPARALRALDGGHGPGRERAGGHAQPRQHPGGPQQGEGQGAGPRAPRRRRSMSTSSYSNRPSWTTVRPPADTNRREGKVGSPNSSGRPSAVSRARRRRRRTRPGSAAAGERQGQVDPQAVVPRRVHEGGVDPHRRARRPGARRWW